VHRIRADKVGTFNQHHVRRAGATIAYPLATADSAGDFADIEAYVVNTGNDLDLDLDPSGLDLSLDMDLD
jgi:hypothetical protein